MSISDYAEIAILDKVFRDVNFSVTGVYTSLHTADPAETGANELSATGAYVRSGATFNAAAAGALDNVANIVFTTMMPSGTVTHVGLWDAQAAGNHLWNGALSASKNVNEGDTFQIGAGDLDISLD